MLEKSLHLPEFFDGARIGAVVDELIKHRRRPLELNAANVKVTGALGLQVLVSAVKQWRHDGVEFRVVNASGAMLDVIETLGVHQSDAGIFAGQTAP